MKGKKYHTFGTISKSNRKIVERDTIHNTNSEIPDHSHSWLDTDSSITSVYVYLAYVRIFYWYNAS